MSAAFFEALTGRLGESGLPVFAEEQVPEGAAFPYVTYRAEAPAPGAAGSGRITCWTREDGRGCVELLDEWVRRAGPGGMLLRFARGAALLTWQRTERVAGGDGVHGCRLTFSVSGIT